MKIVIGIIVVLGLGWLLLGVGGEETTPVNEEPAMEESMEDDSMMEGDSMDDDSMMEGDSMMDSGDDDHMEDGDSMMEGESMEDDSMMEGGVEIEGELEVQ